MVFGGFEEGVHFVVFVFVEVGLGKKGFVLFGGLLGEEALG